MIDRGNRLRHAFEMFQTMYSFVLDSLASTDLRIRDLCFGHCEFIENRDTLLMYLYERERLNFRRDNLLKRKHQIEKLMRYGCFRRVLGI